MSSKTRRSLSKSRRLLRHAEFERVYRQGRRYFASHLTVFFLRRTDRAGLRFGFTVGKALGGAVERNRMKRRLREAVRLSGLERAIPADIVINPRRSLLETDFAEVRMEIEKALETVERSCWKQPERRP
ncbi:MAG: ribonuclease P protein component [Acidobacteria bacterium]|nr:ribonuclease P protein component [Acidobacteriota bacterium]MBV9623291.1 ribonuclease P protein component [Acidobacteriota bacterium]